MQGYIIKNRIEVNERIGTTMKDTYLTSQNGVISNVI